MPTLPALQAGIILPLDKPRQWTSFQAVNKIKSAIRQGLREGWISNPEPSPDGKTPKIKIGHAGTLDPLATGLLLVCIGKATKQIATLQDGDKVYTGTIILGATTPSFDLEHPIDNLYPYHHLTRELVEQAASHLTGRLKQTPPLYSAVKINGQRAYEHARQGNTEAQTNAKDITVYSFEITDYRQPTLADTPAPTLTTLTPPDTTHLYKTPQGIIPPHLPQADFRIHCGKGTYIRSLARDLGTTLQSGGYLASLRREQIGDFSVADAIHPDHVELYLKNLQA